jgi:phosphatidylinositol kinase/protein kinase (PI-3  family)
MMLETDSNQEAERALLSVSKRLHDTLSVEFRVNELLKNATNVDHLANMFPGWQSWL